MLIDVDDVKGAIPWIRGQHRAALGSRIPDDGAGPGAQSVGLAWPNQLQ
jgi:hypothetical protein